MATTTDLKQGTAIKFKNGSWLIVESQFVNPGKGAAFTRAKLKNLTTNQVIENTFRSGESAEVIDVQRTKCQLLYKDNDSYNFMDNQSYEQFSLDPESIGDAKKYLLDGTECYALYLDGIPISVQIPEKMVFTVIETTPGVKGDTATGGSKEASIETGTIIKVPLFIKEGEKILVNTVSGTYVSKA